MKKKYRLAFALLVLSVCVSCTRSRIVVVREMEDVKKVFEETSETLVVRAYIAAAKKGDAPAIRNLCAPEVAQEAVRLAARFRNVRFEDLFAYTAPESHQYIIDAPEWRVGGSVAQPIKDVLIVQLVRTGSTWRIKNIRLTRIVFHRVFFHMAPPVPDTRPATLPIETLDERSKKTPPEPLP